MPRALDLSESRWGSRPTGQTTVKVSGRRFPDFPEPGCFSPLGGQEAPSLIQCKMPPTVIQPRFLLLASVRWGVLVFLPPHPRSFLQIQGDEMRQVDELNPFVNHLLICMATELFFTRSDFPKSAYGTCFVGLCVYNCLKGAYLF